MAAEAQLYKRVVVGTDPDVIDVQQPFTVTLLVYPIARIVSYGAPAVAYAGTLISVTVDVVNDGGEGPIWIHVIDADNGLVVGTRQEVHALPGPTVLPFRWDNLVMPNKTWNLLIEAGHVE